MLGRDVLLGGVIEDGLKIKGSGIDIVSNLVFWSRLMNKLESLRINNIFQQQHKLESLHINKKFQQQQKPLIFTQLTASNLLG